MTKMTGVTQACPASHSDVYLFRTCWKIPYLIQPVSPNSALGQAVESMARAPPQTSHTEVAILFHDGEPLLPAVAGPAVKDTEIRQISGQTGAPAAD